DTVRSYLMFMGPFDQGGPWSNEGIQGIYRFMNRVWTLVTETPATSTTPSAGEASAVRDITRLLHRTIARVTDDYANMRFNTALAGLMEFVNGLNKAREESPEIASHPQFAEAIETLLVLLAPMAPFMIEELWHQRHSELGEAASIHLQPWPEYD